MRTWKRNPLKETICGGPCRTPMRKGDPMLEIRIDGLKATMRRCAACAGEPVPEDLPPLAEPVPITPMVPIPNHVNALPFDYRMAAAGERQPGEEG